MPFTARISGVTQVGDFPNAQSQTISIHSNNRQKEREENWLWTACRQKIGSENGMVLPYESQPIASANSGSFLRYANSKLLCRSAACVGSPNDNNGDLLTKSFSEATMLQETFANNFTPSNAWYPLKRPQQNAVF